MARTKQTARKQLVSNTANDIIDDSDEEMQLEEGEEGEENEDSSQSSTQKTTTSKMPKTYKDPGTLIEVRNLYPGPKDKNGRWSWSTKYPTGKCFNQ